MDLSALIRNTDRLADFEAYVAIIPASEHRMGSLVSHEKELNRLWEAVRSTYDILLIEAEQKKSPQIVEVKSRYMGSYSTYTRGLSLITAHMDRLKSAAQAENSVPLVNLPPCDTPIFYGDYKSWPSFRDMFSALYGNNPRLTPVQKLYYLLQKTAKDAHDAIQTVPLTNDGYAIAWKKLVDTYENKGALINEQLRTLLSIKPLTQENGPSIKSLQRTINDCITNLSLLEVTPEVFYHVMLVYICATKLPENTLSLWEQSKKLCTKTPKWEDMDAFLTAHFKTLESISDIRQSQTVHNPNKNLSTTNPRKNPNFNVSKKPNDSRKVQSFATKTVSTPTVCRCFMCQGSHPLRLCPSFLSQSVEERMSTVKRLRCCSNCLATSHEYKNCKSIHVCSLCKQRHHSLLHRDLRPQGHVPSVASPQLPIASNSAITQQPISSNPANNQTPINFNPSTSTAAHNTHTYSAHLNPNPHSTVLLGSTLCIVHINDIRCATRALVDPGSQGTFISRRLQRKLAIPTFFWSFEPDLN